MEYRIPRNDEALLGRFETSPNPIFLLLTGKTLDTPLFGSILDRTAVPYEYS